MLDTNNPTAAEYIIACLLGLIVFAFIMMLSS